MRTLSRIVRLCGRCFVASFANEQVFMVIKVKFGFSKLLNAPVGLAITLMCEWRMFYFGAVR